MVAPDPAALPASRVLELLKLRQHPAVRMIARDVWPSFSGVDEVVSLTLPPDGEGWRVEGEVLPDQFGVRPESFAEALAGDRALALVARVQATDGASLRWA